MYDYKLNKSFVLVFLSVIFVSLIINICIRKDFDFSYLVISQEDMYSIIIREKREVFAYVLMKRLKQLFVVLILMKAFGVLRLYNIIVTILSGAAGLLLSVQIYYLGIEGVIILIFYILPHYIFYCVAIYYCQRVKLFSCNNGEDIKNLIGIVLIFVAGMVVEGIFMTNFLKFFYQHMVM